MSIAAKGCHMDFSRRLVTASMRAGLADSRTSSGISVGTLSQTMSVSEQICRRYLRGDALPDYDKIVKIADFLKVSPGWLLFGDKNDVLSMHDNAVHIDAELLRYILERTSALYLFDAEHADDFPDFVLALINDISAIDTNHETLKKIIDLAVSSIYSFEERKNKKTS